MSVNRSRLYPAILAVALGLGIGIARGADATAASLAASNDSSTQSMQQKIDQLEAKVEALEAKQTQTTAASDAATVQQMQADADKHSQLLDPTTGTSGYDPATGFHISSDDGNFFLHPWALAQFRGVINDRQSISTTGANGGTVVPASGSPETDGFEIHHVFLGLNGHVVTPNLQYFLDIDVPSGNTATANVPNRGGAETLQDAYMTYRIADGSPWIIKAGQFVDPVWHESNVDDGHLLAGDRSLAGVLLGGNTGLNNGAERLEGVGFQYQTEEFHGEFDLTNGYGTANSPFYNSNPVVNGSPTNFGWSGRTEFKLIGDNTAWDAYNSLSAMGDKTDSLIGGFGFEWTEAANFDNIFLTLDGQYATANGLSIYGALLEDYADWSDTPGGNKVPKANAGTFPNFGGIIQAGYMLTPQWEPFVRYDVSIMNSKFANILAFGAKNAPVANQKATANSHEFTAGVNYYLFGQRAKVTGDLSFLPNGSPIDAPGLGILANQNHSEWVGRVQFQLSL